jgi:hypothetical protein
MKMKQSSISVANSCARVPKLWLKLAAKSCAAVLLAAGLGQSVEAQTYSLSPAWSVANSTAHVANTSNNRGMSYDSISNQVFVATRNGTSSAIDVFDGTTGTLLSGAGGIAGATTLAIDQIGESDDVVLYGVPLTTTVSTTAGSLSVYSWTNWVNNSTPSIAYSSASADPVVTNFPAKRIGDTMAVAGSGVNKLILLGVGGQGTNFVLLHTSNGITFTPTAVFVPTGLPLTSGNIFGIAFYTNNTFLVIPGPNQSGANQNVFLVSYPANFASQSNVVGTVLGSAGTLNFGTGRTMHVAYSPGGKMLGVIQAGNNTPNTNAIFSMSNYTASVTQLATTTFATPNANINNTGMAAFGGAGKTNFFYVLESNNGLQAYAINFTTAAIAPSISSAPVGASGVFPTYNLLVGASGTATLKYQWLASNAGTNISSTFTNISNATNTAFAITTPSTNYYEVIITNSAGSVTSSPVRVALLTPVNSTVSTQLWRVPAGTAGYAYLGTDGTTRGLGYDTNSQRLVVANSGGTIYILDANLGTNIGTMNMTGADTSGGDFLLDQVVVADDGAVYSGNLATSNAKHFKLNRWASPFTNETATVAYDDSISGAMKTGDRWGDTMAVRGSGPNTQILLASRSGTNVAWLTTVDGISFTASIIPVAGVPTGFSGLGITFGDGNSFWSKTSGGDLRKISFDPGLLTGSVVLDYVSSSQIPSSMVGVGVDPIKNILAGIILNNTPNDLQLFQLTGTSDAPVLFHQGFFASANANGNGSVAIAMKFPRVYGLDANNGLLALTYDTPPTTAPTINTPPAGQTAYTNIASVSFGVGASGSLPLYYQWQFSLTTNSGGFSNITLATNSSYTLNTPPLSTAGYYRVIVRNVAGFATSAPPAKLTLLIPTTSVVVTQLWTLPAGSQSFLDGTTYNTRGLAYDTNSGTVFVADNAKIHLLNATNGSYLGDLNVLGIFNGGYNSWLFDQVGVADDGAIYAANLTLSGPGFSIVSWAPGSSVGSPASGYAYGGGTGGDPGSGTGDRWGDTMTVRGAGVNTEILIGSWNNTNVVLFTTTDGISFSPNVITVTNVPLGFSGQGIAFGDGDSFYTKSYGYLFRKVTFERTTWKGGATANSTMPSTLSGIGVDPTANILGGVNFGNTPNDLQLYLLSGNANSPALFEQAFFGSNNQNAQFNSVTTLKGGLGFALDVNNGITAVSYGIPNAPAVTLTSVAYAPGAVTLIWNNTFNNHGYQVQFKNNLLDASWTNVGSPVTAVGATASYTDTTASGATRFYRVVSQ